MGEPDSKLRNKEVSEMLDYSFAQYKVEDLLAKKTIGKYEVDKSVQKYAEVVPKDSATILKKKADKRVNATYEVKVDKLTAPIKKGDVVGSIEIKDKNKVIKKVELTTKVNIEKASILQLYLRYIKEVFTGDINV